MRIVWLRLGVPKAFTGLSCLSVSVLFNGMKQKETVIFLFLLGICSVFESELADVIPVVKTSIGGTRIIGRLCAGEDFQSFYYLWI